MPDSTPLPDPGRMAAALPLVRAWIDAERAKWIPSSRKLSSDERTLFDAHFPAALLDSVRIGLVDAIPTPPVEQLGFPEFTPDPGTRPIAITFGDLVLIHAGRLTPALLFHELIHVAQWDELGPDSFLTTYGYGLLINGYRDSALERIAYDLASEFESRALSGDVGERVRREARMAFETVVVLRDRDD